MTQWKCDLHSHTKWSDGTADIAEMAQGAIDMGLLCLGISEHSPMSAPDAWSMKRENAAARNAEMREMISAFEGRLVLLNGLELDYMTRDFSLEEYDYIIGSVHDIGAGRLGDTIDESAETSLRLVREHFAGDHYAYTSAYYKTLAGFASRKETQIIGHFDIIAKFNEGGRFFDEESPAYLCAAKEAAEALCKSGKIFEINTGAVSRGYRSLPYPSRTLLKFINERGGRITFGSDAHSVNAIAFKFDEAVELAESCGFSSAFALGAQGFIEVPI